MGEGGQLWRPSFDRRLPRQEILHNREFAWRRGGRTLNGLIYLKKTSEAREGMGAIGSLRSRAR